MAEAAVKEPSMEDILSSIRKIISEEGNAPEQTTESVANAAKEASVSSDMQMSDVLNQVRTTEEIPVAQEPVTQAAPQVSQASDTYSDNPSGNEAAKMAASLASIAQTVKSEELNEDMQSTSMAEPVAAETVPEQEDVAMPEPVAETVELADNTSLSSIVDSVVETQPEITQFSESVSEASSEIHVEMAEATPAPTQPAPVNETALETMVQEEVAFKGALMSPSADTEVSGAFDRLKRSAMDDIDAKTEAILRPMLREWLDENLPNMVERMVREEIERVARGV
jgi:cell pole-organizing protein PopZ